MLKTLALAVSLTLAGSAAYAEEAAVMASADETTKVAEALAKVGCKASDVEKESANLFEIDDATCEIGQYDIKLNGEYKITVMTLDE